MMAMSKIETHSIAVFSLAYSPFVGGAELALKEITARLPSYDDRSAHYVHGLPFGFTCFTQRFDLVWPKEETIGNVSIVRLGGGSTRSYYGNRWQKIMYVFRAWRAAERRHQQQPFTAVWAMMAAYAGLAALLFKLRHPEIPLLLTLQEGDSEEHILKRVGVFYPLWKLLFKKADRIQVISAYLAAFARRHGARCPIEIVPNGVTLGQFLQHQGSPAGAAQHIITTSRLVPKNGLDVLLRAVAELKNTWPGRVYRVSVIGEGPERERLVQLAKDLGTGREVEFLGHREPADIPHYLAQADIFVRPSRSEGLGTSFLEAMAAGLPVIGTDVGGIPDFLKHGETGLFSRVDDHKDLAEKLKLLLSNQDLRKKLAANGFRLVREHYTWESVARRMEGLFNIFPRIRARLLVLTGIYPPDIGGSATFSKMLVEMMPGRGLKIQILTYGSPPVGGGVRAVSKRWPKGLRHCLYFVKALWLGRRADALVAADSSFGAAWVGSWAARLLKKRLIVRVTGDYAWEQGMQRAGVTDLMDAFQTKRYGFFVEWLRRCQSSAVKRADAIIAPSEYLKKIAIGWGANPNKINVIYNAVELGELPSCDDCSALSVRGLPERTMARQKLGLSGTVILSVGRLVPWKGFAVLISAFQELVGRISDARLVIIGDGPEYQKLKLEIENLKLENKVFLKGAVSKAVLLQYLRAADVFVLNTAYEGFSHQIIEAMAAGLPVLTTAVGGNPEVITSGTDGFLVDYNNQKQLSQKLEELARDPGLRKRLAEAGQKTAQRFSYAAMVEQLSDLFIQK